MDVYAHENYNNITAVMSQHTAYLTQARGIRTMLTPGRSDGGAAGAGGGSALDPVDSPYNNVFSNGLQRRISEGLRATASQSMQEEDEEPEILTQAAPMSPRLGRSTTSDYSGLPPTSSVPLHAPQLQASQVPMSGMEEVD
jgi:hypothetical protein